MRPESIQLSATHCLILTLILTAAMLSQGCGAPEKGLREGPLYAPESVSSSACIDVDGVVLGNPIPGANVSLYEISSLTYSVVMSEIRTNRPAKRASLNSTRGFNFSCVDPGNYAFVIPVSSYAGVVGSPLPYEFDCETLSLDIVFQGGDYQYSVGVFSIISASHNTSHCDEYPRLCPRKGWLYHDCPLDREG